MHYRTLVTAALSLLPALAGAESPRSADVIVYGATPAGVCAAIGAAREGAKVLLVEPSGHVGGVNTGGLSFSDSNQTARSALLGLFEEFHQRIEDDYRRRGVELDYKVAVKNQATWTYEPHVAARVFDAMLKEADVAVVTRQWLTKVDKAGTRITGFNTDKGGQFTAGSFIDATYEGDLMAAAGVGWTIGREGRGEFNESYAGKQYPKKAMNISGFDDRGQLLPFITTRDAGPAEEGDKNVMVYSFRLCLTENPELRVPFPTPAQYDPARFEAIRRYFLATPNPPLPWDLYPIPGGKFDANNGIGKQFSMGLVGGGNAWCESDAAGRDKIWEAHKQYTLEYYHFLTTDPSVPQPIRDRMAKLGLCKDEFEDYGHWSPQLYVREGRRMRGERILTQADILQTNTKPDSIAVASFPIDSHDCQRIALPDGTVIAEGTIRPVRLDPKRRDGPAYQVPYRSVTPKAAECTNLLVPVALSATHVAYSSIRVEPSWMVIGHSTGIAAAMAAREKKDVQSLDYPRLKERLHAQKQVTDLP